MICFFREKTGQCSLAGNASDFNAAERGPRTDGGCMQAADGTAMESLYLTVKNELVKIWLLHAAIFMNRLAPNGYFFLLRYA